MPDTDTLPETPATVIGVENVMAEPAAPQAAPSDSRTTRARTPAQPRAARPRTPRKKKGPTAAELAAIAELRQELVSAREELEAARREVAEVVEACREAEARVAARRADADAIRRAVSEVDSAAAAVRGIAEAARAEAERTRESSEQTELRLARLNEWIDEARGEFAKLDAESRQTLERFRAAVEELRRGPGEGGNSEEVAALPDAPPLPAGEQAGNLRERLVHLLNDAWAVEKEQVGLLQTLADECGDREIASLLEEDRAACQQRQEEVAAWLETWHVRPTSGRGLLGQLTTRIWDAVLAPGDHADKVVLTILKALSAAEFQAGLYAAAHAYARSVGGNETAERLAGYFRQERTRADRLRAALGPTVGRAARR